MSTTVWIIVKYCGKRTLYVRLGMAGGGEVCSHAGALLYTLEHVYNSLEQGF
jgi:hypothetical protein